MCVSLLQKSSASTCAFACASTCVESSAKKSLCCIYTLSRLKRGCSLVEREPGDGVDDIDDLAVFEECEGVLHRCIPISEDEVFHLRVEQMSETILHPPSLRLVVYVLAVIYDSEELPRGPQRIYFTTLTRFVREAESEKIVPGNCVLPHHRLALFPVLCVLFKKALDTALWLVFREYLFDTLCVELSRELCFELFCYFHFRKLSLLWPEEELFKGGFTIRKPLLNRATDVAN